MPVVEPHLAALDQASVLLWRALGRGQLVQLFWRFPDGIDPEALERFRGGLAHTLLGRRVERSSLPFGRDRWVRAAEPGPLLVAPDALDPALIGTWTATAARLPVDPEDGPGWFLSVASLTDGGVVVGLTVSHVIGDGLAVAGAVRAVVLGNGGTTPAPPPRVRVTAGDRLDDLRVAARAVPGAVRGLAATVRLAREERDVVPGSLRRSVRSRPVGGGAVVDVPVVLARIADTEWRARAEALGGSTNTLCAGLAVRLGAALGRVDADGCVTSSLPISDRVAGDTRANANDTLVVRFHPDGVTSDLRGLRAEIRRGLADLREHGSLATAALAVAPFVPRAVARRLEEVVLENVAPVVCSWLGEHDPTVARPMGVVATDCWVVGGEPVPEEQLRRVGGALTVVGGSVNGRVGVSVRGWQPGAVTTQGELLDRVRRVFAEFGLPGAFH